MEPFRGSKINPLKFQGDLRHQITTLQPQPSDRTRSAWAPWHPLEEVVVGTCINDHYFDEVRDAAVREPLNQMLRETQEDLDALADLIRSMGVTVIRPPQLQDLRLNPRERASLVQPVELVPRDMAVQVGPHTLYRTVRDRGVVGSWLRPPDINEVQSAWFELFHVAIGMEPAGWTMVGNRLIVDGQQFHYPGAQRELEMWAERWLPGVEIVTVDAGCHTDSWFQCIRPGVLLTCADPEDHHIFEETFPGWSVHHIQGIKPLKQPWEQYFGNQHHHYWLPGADKNPKMQRFIQDWLQMWQGAPSETVFEINSIMINEHTMIACEDNPTVRAWLKSHGVELVISPLRHRWYWDGGISCFTMPTSRQGVMEDFSQF